MTRPPRWPGAALLLCGAGLVASTVGGARLAGGAPGWLSPADTRLYGASVFAAAAFYAGAVWLSLHRPLPRWALPAVFVVAVAVRAVVLVETPVLSSDIYRYVWDGRVQNAGISPYRYLPADLHLQELRDPGPPERPGAVYANINRVDSAPTIYPPFAQAMFAAVERVWPGIWSMKGTITAFDLVTLVLLVLLLRAAGLPGVQAVVWAWSPLVVWEFANEGHVDAAANAFVAAALLAAVWGWRGRAGAALAAAALFKLLPITLFPAIWRRWNWRGPLVALAVILLAYAPYTWFAGRHVFGYLGGYTQEEGVFTARYLPLRLVALGLLGGAGAWFAFGPALPVLTTERARTVCRQALALTVLLLAVISPKYPWYYTALLVPGTVVPAWCVLWVTAAVPLLYFYDFPSAYLWILGPAIPLLAIDLLRVRHRLRRRSQPGAPPA